MAIIMRTAIVFRERLLAPSETFIIEQAQMLRRYKPVLAGLRRVEPGLRHNLPEILLREGTGTWDKIAARVYRQFPFAPAFIQRLRAQNPSILHVHFATDAVHALSIANALELPLVVSLHGCDVTPTDAHFAQSVSGRHFLSHRSRLFARASAFLCVSQSICAAALRAGFPEAKLHVLYTGVDCERFRPADVERDPKLILFVGRLVEVKGCEFLLRAMAHLQQHNPQAHVEIIGDGPLRSDLEALAGKLAIRASFRGVQNSAEVLRSMARARILCNPSIKASSGQTEGFGMVFAEAQAVGTPVVSFASAAIPEVVKHGHTGLLCPEGDIVALATSLRTLLDNSELWASMSHQARTWVKERFDIARQTEKLELIYDECIARQRRIASPFPEAYGHCAGS
jgi:glycosyltransferase involved in cell wall biosynthesis